MDSQAGESLNVDERGRSHLLDSLLFRILAVALALYVGSYFMLSRYSYYRYGQRNEKSENFWYVPAEPMRIFTTNSLLAIHVYASLVYYPVWVADRALFNGPQYAQLHGCPTF